MSFDFAARNRRPPRDPVNALLSLGYSLLAKDLTVACYAVGFDPMIGFYHQPRHGRPALALDLMEPLRPLIADSAVLSAVNTKMVSERDFVMAGQAVSLTPGGTEGLLPCLRVPDGDACNAPVLRIPCQLSQTAGDASPPTCQDLAGRTG